ncbi:anthranilate synthase component I family protein [Actinotignum urinale]|uniref:Anthranilate synthase component 1 n=1 Tax=Actinotignum urinale TaxID=190146 RepID=A0AAW9HT60_9ACTO|nr:anthranilate synthase component I family protein [Actinotignum urinale]MDY5128742.1 anthranilate synthase component I family protein [Actinotignum urinale]MDY5154268.1 anthranilate synthase component I family protein [Actinotignum urinale]
MNIYPSLETVLELSEKYTSIPIATDILSDMVTPVSVLRKAKAQSKHVYLLESAAESEGFGRYTFIGYDPSLEITALDGCVHVGDKVYENVHPAKLIREVLATRRAPSLPEMPPFTGGLVGYFAYDYVKYGEPTLKLDAPNNEGFNDVDLMLFDRVIAFDNYKQKIQAIAHVEAPEGASHADVENAYRKAVTAIHELVDLVINGTPTPHTSGRMTGEVEPQMSREEFEGVVLKAQHHIHEGDIFQIVPSNALTAPFEGSLLDTYRVLRTINPSPYMFYFSGHNIEVAGASPETLVKLENGVLHTYPLAGTRKRGATPEEDVALERELLADPKEVAEHNMLVDLGRNDIGRVAEFGSVEVEKYLEVLRFSHVMHIGSIVRGDLREGLDALDVVEAILPAGTLSGAPKIRAMQLINELEGNKRGLYGGGIGYLDFSGNMDLCIAIRVAYRVGGRVFARSGAGIVRDSVPSKEYDETINKAAATMKALRDAEAMSATEKGDR